MIVHRRVYRASAELTEHCANGLNRRARRRTPLWFDQWSNLINGFTNALQPDNCVWRLAERTDVFLRDADGRSITGATVDVYLDQSPLDVREGPSGPAGSVVHGRRSRCRRPARRSPEWDPGRRHGPEVDGDHPGRAHGPCPRLRVPARLRPNLVYFRQGQEHGEMELRVKMHPY